MLPQNQRFCAGQSSNEFSRFLKSAGTFKKVRKLVAALGWAKSEILRVFSRFLIEATKSKILLCLTTKSKILPSGVTFPGPSVRFLGASGAQKPHRQRLFVFFGA